MKNDLVNELGLNFIEYAVAVNSDRAIPDAKSGLKPVAKRILYGAYDCGFSSSKPHVKCANIVGNVMAEWHPHGDSSIYGALVRLSQPWVMRYPLIDFHGSNGNIDGDGPAAYRYTEARLSKFTEEGLLAGIKKKNVDFIPNYSETKDEPVTLPAIFPNLLCNPNAGIGVAMACSWACHNLNEVADAIYAYMDGEEPMLPGPDFPTGGLIINKNDIPNIMRTGHGSVKIRGKYNIEGNNIVFYEIPYGVGTEALMNQIGEAADSEKIKGIVDIRNESNKKGYRLVIECDKKASALTIVNKLFAETNLQTSFSYNQVALIDKTPTELNLKDCIKIYIEHNLECIKKEAQFDLEKASKRYEVVEGLLRALEDIDNIIVLIKSSDNSKHAEQNLIEKYSFTENQAKAICAMKLGSLAKLEAVELNTEKADLAKIISDKNILINEETARLSELRTRLMAFVAKYGDPRRTELAQIEVPKEEKEIEYVEPEKCVVVMTESGLIKRVPTASFRTQNRNTKGVKTQDDITNAVIRTNTIDNLMIFTNKGKMYRLLVDNIPVGTNKSQGVPINSLVSMEGDEIATTMYSLYRDTDAKYVLFITETGLVKKTALEEFTKTKKKTGIAAIKIKEGDKLASVSLIKDEDIILLTKNGQGIRFKSSEINPSGRVAMGVKGITLKPEDKVVAGLVVRHDTDDLAIFAENGLAKKIKLTELVSQKRAGKGVIVYKNNNIASATLITSGDRILVCGTKTSLCVAADDIPEMGRTSIGNQIIKGSQVLSVSKV